VKEDKGNLNSAQLNSFRNREIVFLVVLLFFADLSQFL